jgi:hypothetical protein
VETKVGVENVVIALVGKSRVMVESANGCDGGVYTPEETAAPDCEVADNVG